MLRLALAQMRRSLGRLTAAGIAVAIGTAFVAATLLASEVLTRTTFNAVAAAYAHADLVVTGAEVGEQQLAAVAAVPGVAAADGVLEGYSEFRANGRVAYLLWSPVPSDPRLHAQQLVEGRLPTVGEVALPEGTVERLSVGVGDTVTRTVALWQPADAAQPAIGAAAEAAGQGDGEWLERQERLRVSGIVADPAGAFAQSGGAAVVAAADAHRWYAVDTGGEPLHYAHLLVLLDDSANLEQVRAAVADAVGAPGAELAVRTRDEQASLIAEDLSGDAHLLTGVVLGFAAIALIVASLVIANTFAVLVAERTRSLALLRCVGASTRQLRRSVTVEALLLGAGASLVGIAVGTGLAQVALIVLNQRAFGVPLPAAVSVGPAVLALPLVAGVVVTLLAALAPARAAGRVAPLAALRPAAGPSMQEPAGRWRLALSVLAVAGGLGLLVLGMIAATRVAILLGLGIGILGGLLSFTGVLVGAVFWVPRLIGAAGRLLARFAGPASKLAAANTVRNPRRTAATSAALLIGVTLVAMMSTGAASARRSLDNALDRQYPVDIAVDGLVGTPGIDSAAGIDPALTAAVGALGGVAQVAELRSAPVVLSGAGVEVHATARALDPREAAGLLRNPALLAALEAGSVVLPAKLAEDLATTEGQRLSLAAVGPEGEPAGTDVELTVAAADLAGGAVFVTPATLARLAPDAPVTSLWVRLVDTGEAPDVVADIQEVFSEAAVHIAGAAVERAMYERVINTLLAVVIGLLGVAVVVALVGVTNTLSLSVFERRRESATLRAIGLTRRQLRQTLAVEGVLIAGSGALLGSVLGTLYGWMGTRTVLGPVAEGVSLAIAWRDLGLVLAISLVAGLAASVLPGRRAARTAPVAALAEE